MEKQKRLSLPLVRFNRRKEKAALKGPLRVIRLCVLSILLPGLLIAGPLYLRYRVFSEQVYPLGMSDMRLVDNKISTTWCQRQLVKSNATYSAYLLPQQPEIEPGTTHVSMVRYLDLGDDMKEYWGFYLLKGSSVTVSTCCRWPGASLIVIRGHKHLRECAYIGDDSSEEMDELEEIRKEREELEKKQDEKNVEDADIDDGESNEPRLMMRARPSVVFHGSKQEDDLSNNRLSKEVEDNDNDHFIGKFLVKKKMNNEKGKKKENTQEAVQNFSGAEQGDIVNRTHNGSGEGVQESSQDNYLKEDLPESIDIVSVESDKDNVEVISEKQSSDETIQDILKRILGLGQKGKDALFALKDELNLGDQNFPEEKVQSKENNSISKKLNFENIGKEKLERLRREIVLSSLQDDLTKNDEDSNAAEEEGITPGQDIRGRVNETTHNDMSNSEFWSSFSSSEERLLSCSGLILNLPLTPQKECQADLPEELQIKAGLRNKLTYQVPSNGYYFFVFSSENEIQPNYIRIHFQLEKTLYNVSNPVAACQNTTDSCSLPLDFFSKEKVVLELPVNSNDSLWNEEYIVVSTCEPRTMIYASCVIAVPILILLLAF